ncbi:MAG: hypothetical protein ACLRVT_01860 [Oscillospiraceae bacterium]
MAGMLKVERFRFCTNCSLWVILAVLLGSCCISIVTGVYDSAESALLNLSLDSMVPLLAGAVYSGLLLTDDFSNGSFYRYLAAGYRRSTIILAKFLHYLFGCTVLLLFYPLAGTLLAGAVQGTQSSLGLLLKSFFQIFLLSLPVYLGILSLFFAVAMLVQKGAWAMGISTASCILVVVFSNKLYSGPESITHLLPVIQLQEIARNSSASGSYVLCAALSLSIILGAFILSTVLIRRQEF